MKERNQYLNAVAEIIVPFLNDDQRDSTATADAFIRKFAIADVKSQATVRIMFHHMEQWALMDTDATHKYFSGLIALDTNILTDIAMDEWEDLNNRLQ